MLFFDGKGIPSKARDFQRLNESYIMKAVYVYE